MTTTKHGIVLGFLFISTMLFCIPLFASTSATSLHEQSTKELPLDQPNLKTEDLIRWATEAVEATLTYSFDDYQSRMQNAEKYYTAKGWSIWVEALDASGNIKSALLRKLKIIAKVVGTENDTKVTPQGTLDGAYVWKVELPVLVTYQEPPYDKSSSVPNALMVTVIIQRQPLQQGYKGLAILMIEVNQIH